jgi:hypothetical protein
VNVGELIEALWDLDWTTQIATPTGSDDNYHEFYYAYSVYETHAIDGRPLVVIDGV